MVNKLKMVAACAVPAVGFLLLTGCASSNVSRFQPDIQQAYNVKSSIRHKVSLGRFSMLAAQDKNSIMCRFSGNIYLPNKMVYSSYIKHAFAETLIDADRYVPNRLKGSHTLSANISKVNFSSVSGHWVIQGSVRVDRYKPVWVDSRTSFGTSWSASSACKNVANGFETAVSDFVNKTLSNRRVVRELNK